MKRLSRWLPHTMFVGSGGLALVIAVSVSTHLVRVAHAQFDGDAGSTTNSTPPSPPPIIGEPPPQAPPAAPPPSQPQAAAPPPSSPFVGDNPVPPPPAAPQQPPSAAPVAPPSSPLVGNNPLPPPPSAAPIQGQQIPPSPQMNQMNPPPNPPPQVQARPQAPPQVAPRVSPAPPNMATPPQPPQMAPAVVANTPPPEVTFLEPYVFDMREGRRNPFRPYAQVENGTTANAGATLPGTPLERYELEEIKLVGIMWQIKLPKAMFVDPQGEVHVLTKDDRIGRHHGYIAQIRENEVVIIEPGSVIGESAYSTRILQLDRDQKDKR